MNAKSPSPLKLALILLLLAGATVARAQDRPHEYNRGFQLGLGWGASRVDLDLDGRQQVPASEAGFDAAGSGLDLVAGWGFGPRFRTEFSLYFANHDPESEAFDVYSGGFRFEGVYTLAPGWRLQPELIAGMGWGGVVYTDQDEPDYLYGWLQGNVGAGLRYRMGENWSLNGQYVLSLLNVEREYVNDGDGDEDNFVEGDGRLHRLSVRLVYGF